jgi:DNA-binding CsgD family transcriptional regulator
MTEMNNMLPQRFPHAARDNFPMAGSVNAQQRSGQARPLEVPSMTSRTVALTPTANTSQAGHAPFALRLQDDAGGPSRGIDLGPTERAPFDARSAAIDEGAIVLNALHAYAFGVIICDDGARVKFANAAARMLARQGAAILLHRGQLSAMARHEAFALASLIRDATRGGTGGGIQFTGRDGTITILGLVTPLPRQSCQKREGLALVSLRATADRPSLSAAALAAMFRLSPCQASVALAIFNGKTPEEIATDRGVRISTLRSHLAEIFARTGTENQRDLVLLLAMLPPLAFGASDIPKPALR